MPDHPLSPPSTILIVEDEAIVAADLEQRLQRLGYRTMGPAASAEEALALARAEKPDLTLMDIRLQGPTDGIAAAGILRKEMEVPVIFLTSHADQATLERAQVAEAFGYLLKPFDERLLQITIGMAIYKNRMELDRKRLTQELEEALAEVKVLSGMLPICSGCKKIEDESGRWERIETYITKRTEAEFSHTMCPDCLRKLYPDIADAVLARTAKIGGGPEVGKS
jgi:two-component system, response regulator PdtaR